MFPLLFFWNQRNECCTEIFNFIISFLFSVTSISSSLSCNKSHSQFFFAFHVLSYFFPQCSTYFYFLFHFLSFISFHIKWIEMEFRRIEKKKGWPAPEIVLMLVKRGGILSRTNIFSMWIWTWHSKNHIDRTSQNIFCI